MSDSSDIDRADNPLRLGLRNAGIALASVGVAGAGYFLKYRAVADNIAWWVFAVVPAAIVIISLVHAYIAAQIGRRKADRAFRWILLAVLVGGVYGLTRYLAR